VGNSCTYDPGKVIIGKAALLQQEALLVGYRNNRFQSPVCARWIEPMALVAVSAAAHRVETRCCKMGRAYGSGCVARRGVASVDIVTTDFNPLYIDDKRK